MVRRAQGSGSVYPRKDGRFAASASYEGKRITKYGKTKKEAWDNLQAALDDLKAGRVVIGPKQTVKQYLEKWLEKSKRLEIEVSTIEQYRTIVYYRLLPAFGHLRLDQLNRDLIQEYYVGLVDEGLSSGYIENIHILFSAALKDAVENSVLARNPCQRVTLPQKKDYEAHFLTLEEARHLVKVAKGHRLWFFILMAVTTGARRGELTCLKWDDVDLNQGVVHVSKTGSHIMSAGYVVREPKTKSGFRKIRLPQVVIEALEEHKKFVDELKKRNKKSWIENNLIFPNNRGGYLNHTVVLKQFKVLLAQAGLPLMHFHDLRHSAATLLLAAGVNIKVVQEILGHSDVRTTLNRYAHVLPDMQKEASSKMNDMFS